MEATAHMLMSCFAAYGHGVLMKPISEKNLPEIQYKNYSEKILKETTWSRLDKTIEEELKDEHL